MESRRDKFKRLAEKRTKEVLSRLRILGNLSNKSSYEYTSEDIGKIFKAVDEQTRLTKSKFKVETEQEFKL
jgi:hypothetical protein